MRLNNGLSKWRIKFLNPTKFWTIFFVIISALIRGICYIIQIPPWYSPDEVSHFSYVRKLTNNGSKISISEHSRLPEGSKIPTTKRLHSINEFQQKNKTWQEISRSMEEFNFSIVYPDLLISSGDINNKERAPLYYFVSFAVIKLLGVKSLIGQFYLCRIISMLFGIGIIIITFFTAHTIFPKNFLLSISCTLLISLIPQSTLIHSSVNADTMVNFLCSLFIFLIVKGVFSCQSKTLLILEALTVFLAILAKRSAIILIPIWFLSIMLSYWNKGKRNWPACISAAVIITITFSGTLVLIKEFFPSAFSRMLEPFFKLSLYENIIPYGGWLKFHEHLFVSFVGVFGWLRFPLHGLWYYILAVLVFISILGLFKLFKNKQDNITLHEAAKKQSLVILIIFFIITYLSVYLGYGVYYNMHAQGRYLLPSLVPIVILFAAGLENIFQRNKKINFLIPSPFFFLSMSFVSLIK